MAERDSKAVPPAGPCPGGDVEILAESLQGEWDTVTGHSSSSESGESPSTPTPSQPPTPAGMEGCSSAVKADSGARKKATATSLPSSSRRSRSQDSRPSTSKSKSKATKGSAKTSVKSQDSIISLTLSQDGSNAASTPRKRSRNSPGSNSDPQVTAAKKRHITSSPGASLGQSSRPPLAAAPPPCPWSLPTT